MSNSIETNIANATAKNTRVTELDAKLADLITREAACKAAFADKSAYRVAINDMQDLRDSVVVTGDDEATNAFAQSVKDDIATVCAQENSLYETQYGS